MSGWRSRSKSGIRVFYYKANTIKGRLSVYSQIALHTIWVQIKQSNAEQAFSCFQDKTVRLIFQNPQGCVLVKFEPGGITPLFHTINESFNLFVHGGSYNYSLPFSLLEGKAKFSQENNFLK